MTFAQFLISIVILVFYAGVVSVAFTLCKEAMDDFINKDVKVKRK